MASKALAYLWLTATQGSADAFVQASGTTGLYNVTGIAYRIREILVEWAGTNGISGVAAATWEWALSRKSLSAMPLITDKSVVVKSKKSQVLTTSGFFQAQQVERLLFGETDDVLLVEDPIYLQLDSTSTTVVNTLYCRIGYEQVKISDVDRLTLIANSLSA